MVKIKVFNDPIYKMMRFDHEVLYRIIDHPYFQRLRRISQLALSHYVFPGGQHSRYQHALGALHLLHHTIHTLRNKGVEITEEESRGVCIAILLHDIGHGPFSHALEGIILPYSHEQISYAVMEIIGRDLGEDFSIAKQIYKNEYPKRFLHQLVSSQLDMDRMDYLTRDSFFSGVAEGIIGYDRIIAMMNVSDNQLVIEENGLYSIEKFLVARKLMYWQVYLHKAAIGAEQVLVSVVKRAKDLLQKGLPIYSPDPFTEIITCSDKTLNEAQVERYLSLDDVDILYMIKKGMLHPDKVYSTLCRSVIDRKLFKTEFSAKPVSADELFRIKTSIEQKLSVNEEEAGYFLLQKKETFLEYNNLKEEIMILTKAGDVVPFSEINPEYSQKQPITKYATCYWQE